MHICNKLGKMGMNIVGAPKTIDNDLDANRFDLRARLRSVCGLNGDHTLYTTASSHHRVIVVEVTCRYAGWIALNGGLAGGADIILIPEIPFEYEIYTRPLKSVNCQGNASRWLCS